MTMHTYRSHFCVANVSRSVTAASQRRQADCTTLPADNKTQNGSRFQNTPGQPAAWAQKVLPRRASGNERETPTKGFGRGARITRNLSCKLSNGSVLHHRARTVMHALPSTYRSHFSVAIVFHSVSAAQTSRQVIALKSASR